MMDYVKMEAEYYCSKEVLIVEINGFYNCQWLATCATFQNVKVLYKLKKGLESENADMNRDVEAEYRDILK